ncbi:hypothetical protein JMUB6875_73520 [Nocardia sp. JMUB6875]
MYVSATEFVMGDALTRHDLHTSGPVTNIWEVPATINTKSVNAGAYAAPPAQGRA